MPTPSTTTDEPISETALRNTLVDGIVADRRARGLTVSAAVEAALRTVPRRLFLPGVPAREAYGDDAVVTKRDEQGVSISSVSAPNLIALMLEQLGVQPGDRVLEIGSGGYNAALLRELVGPDGQVTTVDIDPEVTDRARVCLTAAGYGDVTVVCADGEYGWPSRAPFDRLIVTVGAWDIPPAWNGQLAAGGRLVVPLRIRGLTRSIAFEPDGGHLASLGYEQCGFVPMQGSGERGEQLVVLHGDDVALRIDDQPPLDPAGLATALSRPRSEAWSGVTAVRGDTLEHQDLWLATTLPAFALLTATTQAIDAGLVRPTWRLGTPAVTTAGSLAYRTLRPTSDPDTFEFGVYGHGPAGQALADQLAAQIRVWDRDHRSRPPARIRVYPAATVDDALPAGLVVDKRHSRVTISWP